MKQLKTKVSEPEKLPISNPNKVFWPDEGYTKLQLEQYYEGIFPSLRPYVEDRLLSLERCPDGMRGQCFYQKEKPNGMPRDTPTKRLSHATGRKFTNYVVGGSLATQSALVNLGCIAVHVMGSRATSPRQPDWVCIDIDPESGAFADAALAGLRVKKALEALELISFPKTSGSRGMHVFVPIRRGPDADEVLSFARALVTDLAATYPDELTVEHSLSRRRGRVYLDPFRNGFGQTVVAPYSVRRRLKAPISTPLAWSEVTTSLDPSDFNLGNFADRMKRKDPWADFFSSRQSLTKAMRLFKAS